jgi:hypothetical protein
MQETKCTDDKFPFDEFSRIGYCPSVFGQQSYNGVAIVARQQCADLQRGNYEDHEGAHARLLAGTIGGVRIVNVYIPNGQSVGSAFGVQHPGGALGYRFSAADAPGSSFVYISDNELGAGELYRIGDRWRQRLADFVRGTKLLVHDATYTTDEYDQHRGWGHSTYDDAVALALEAEVEELVLFHHKPERSDDEVDRCVAHCREVVAKRGGTLRVIAAAEGMTLTV